MSVQNESTLKKYTWCSMMLNFIHEARRVDYISVGFVSGNKSEGTYIKETGECLKTCGLKHWVDACL